MELELAMALRWKNRLFRLRVMIIRIPTWPELKVFSQARIVQLSILAPFFGYLILFSEQIHEYFRLIDAVESNFVFKIRLYLLYFGTTILGISAAIFNLACPRPIKNNDDESAYLEKETAYFNSGRSFLSFSSALRDAYDHRNESLIKKLEMAASERIIENTPDSRRLREIFWDIWHHYEHSRRAQRLIIKWLNVTGILMILIPSAMIMWNVFGMIISDISAKG